MKVNDIDKVVVTFSPLPSPPHAGGGNDIRGRERSFVIPLPLWEGLGEGRLKKLALSLFMIMILIRPLGAETDFAQEDQQENQSRLQESANDKISLDLKMSTSWSCCGSFL